MSAPVDHALLVIGGGTSSEVRIETGKPGFSLVSGEIFLRTSTTAAKAMFRAIDASRVGWSKVTFGKDVKAYLNGTLAFRGIVGPVRTDVVGAGVFIEFDCLGRSYLLYSKNVSVDATYFNQTTGALAKAVIDAEFGGILTTTGVTTATGVTLEEFSVTEGDNVGQVLERLAALDGYSFDVNESDDVQYFTPSVVSQLTIAEDDLAGSDRQRVVESGVIPPRNIVRVIGSDGYLFRTRQESRDSYYRLNSTTRVVAQRVLAESARLSAVQFFLDRSLDPNQPAALTFEVQTDGTTTLSDAYVSTAGTSFSLDGTTKRATYPIYATGRTDPDMTFVSISALASSVGSPGTATASVYAADASWTPTGSALASATMTFGGGSLAATLNYSFDATTKFVVVVSAAGVDGANYYALTRVNPSVAATHYTSTNSGTSWSVESPGLGYEMTCTTSKPSGTRVEWSNDFTISASDVAYPAAWSAVKSWSDPKLVVTNGAYYWLVLKDTAASGTKYWDVGYHAASNPYAAGKSLSSTDSGTTWAQLGHDLTFRAFWSQDAVDYLETNAASISAYGEWYYSTTEPSITTQAEAEAVAGVILARHAAPLARMTLPLRRCVPSLTPRAVVTVRRPLLNISGDYEVAEVQHTITRDSIRSTVIIGAREFNAARALEQVRKKVS